jgi:hypothetical protein
MKTNLKAIYDHPGMKALYEAIGAQNHRTLVLWALDTAAEILGTFTMTFPGDPRPRQALDAAESWSRGEIKIQVAKRAAKETHQAATDAKADPTVAETKKAAAAAVAHAMGQAIGVVHVSTHSTAFAAYVVQALVIANPERNPEEVLGETTAHLLNRLKAFASAEKDNRPWANFL